MPTPFALDVLERTLGGAVRLVELDDRTVVRTVERPDHRAGNAVHLHDVPAVGDVALLLDDAAGRFAGRARLVAPLPVDDDPAADALRAAAERAGATARIDELRVLDGAPAPATPRPDLSVSPPTDDRAWHGVSVLHRHAGPGDDPAASPGSRRGRGADDDLLRWWVAGLADLVATGRARVLRAERHGTPVGVGTLVWDPRVEVGPDHAGLAVLTDHVVHPAHRGLGIGRALADELVRRHLDDFPSARVAAVLPRALGPAADRAGLRLAARLLVAHRDEPAPRDAVGSELPIETGSPT